MPTELAAEVLHLFIDSLIDFIHLCIDLSFSMKNLHFSLENPRYPTENFISQWKTIACISGAGRRQRDQADGER